MNPTDLLQQLIGAWTLISLEQEDAEGNKMFPFGTDAKGIILYTPDVYMSAQIMAADGPGYLAYSGPFTTNHDGSVLSHKATVSLNREWLGSEQVRLVRIEGELLHLETEKPVMTDGQLVTARLVWIRLKP